MLHQFFQQLDEQRERLTARIPPKKAVQQLADQLFEFLFPILSTDPKPAAVVYPNLRYDLEMLLGIVLRDSNGAVRRISDAFFNALPDVHNQLKHDAEAFLQFDPAATCIEEVIATYPGFHAVSVYRIAHLLHELEVPLIPRFFSEYIHGKTGIDIHPAATIGRSFFIDHGTGVVIGATAVIGNNVKIYQGVTLGALQVDKSMANTKRHPTIEDDCIIYANSTILGGRTVIGQGSIVGGNTWLTESVPAQSIVLHRAEHKVRTKLFDEPLNFVI